MTLRMLSWSRFSYLLRHLLTVCIVTSPAAVAWSQQPTTTESPAVASQSNLDLEYVSPRAVVLASIRPSDILTAPAAQLYPVEVATAAGLQHLNIDPAQVDSITAFVEPPMAGPPQAGIIIRFSQPFRGSSIPKKLRAHTTPGKLGGRPYLKSVNPMLPSLYMSNSKTLLLAQDELMQRMVELGNTSGPESPLMKLASKTSGNDHLYLAVDIATLRPMINALIAQAQQQGKVPPPAFPFLDVPNRVSSLEAVVNLSYDRSSSLIAHANNEEDAENIERLMQATVMMLKAGLEMQLSQEMQKKGNDPVAVAAMNYSKRMSEHYTKTFMPKRDGADIVIFSGKAKDNPFANVAGTGILIALVLPAIQAAREAARRNSSVNNMKQLMLSMHNYYDTHNSFPPQASYSADGKPLLSWRVHMLPYLEENELYKQFHLDEPWDSTHNVKLIPLMPKLFHDPSSPMDPTAGKTHYVAPVGKEFIFDGTPVGKKFEQITDGSSLTVMAVQVDDAHAVIWTKPEDLRVADNNPLSGLGGLHPSIFLAGFADGHVRAIEMNIDPTTFRAMLTSAGGERIPR